MTDTHGKTGRGPLAGLPVAPIEPVIRTTTLVPARRMSLPEENAFPVASSEIQAPRVPPDVKEQKVVATSQRKLLVYAFIVVAALGTAAAVRLYFAVSSEAATQE